MVLLLGGSGYIGEAFQQVLKERGLPYRNLSRREVDYSSFDTLYSHLKETRPEFLINSAGYTGKPNVDACELAQADTLHGNSILPVVVASACSAAGIPWGHVSSGCIYAGAKVRIGSELRVEKDLTQPALRELMKSNRGAFSGFTESDEPNFSFRNPPCSFYSGSKALGEEALGKFQNGFIWRLRIPFDEIDNPRNYLTKIQRYPKVYDNVNSVSHRFDFVNACLDTWKQQTPFGIYNVTNPGFVTTREVVALIEKTVAKDRRFEFWASDEEFYKVAAKTPRSNCIMDTTKLTGSGVKMRPVHDALEDSLRRWKKL